MFLKIIPNTYLPLRLHVSASFVTAKSSLSQALKIVLLSETV